VVAVASRAAENSRSLATAGQYATIASVTDHEPDWRQRKKTATRDRIRASALRLFHEQG
jgi:hypothetical protein